MKFFSYKDELEQLLNVKVDLLSTEGLSRHVKPYVDKDKVLIYEDGCLTRFGSSISLMQSLRSKNTSQIFLCKSFSKILRNDTLLLNK